MTDYDVAFDESVKISGWNHNGDTHTATVTFDVDANYILKVTSTDLAGNSTETSVCSFVVDTTAPTGEIKIDDNIWETLLNVNCAQDRLRLGNARKIIMKIIIVLVLEEILAH